MATCTFKLRPRAYTGDTGATCGRETSWYWRPHRNAAWEERCDKHAPETETSERIPMRRSHE